MLVKYSTKYLIKHYAKKFGGRLNKAKQLLTEKCLKRFNSTVIY